MKLFLSKFKKLGVIVLNISIILFSSYFILHSEKFQQRVSPRKYWQNKVKSIEDELKRDSIKIKTLKLNLEKEIALSTYHKKQAKIKAEEQNQNVGDIYFKIETDHIKKIKEIKNEIDELSLEEEKLKRDLIAANSEMEAVK